MLDGPHMAGDTYRAAAVEQLQVSAFPVLTSMRGNTRCSPPMHWPLRQAAMGVPFGQVWGQQLNLPVISRPKIGAALLIQTPMQQSVFARQSKRPMRQQYRVGREKTHRCCRLP